MLLLLRSGEVKDVVPVLLKLVLPSLRFIAFMSIIEVDRITQNDLVKTDDAKYRDHSIYTTA